MKRTLAVVGGGAAGFFCAVNAARLAPHLRVVLLEKSLKLLAKVRVSGGGRCNVTHGCASVGELVRHYPRGQAFLKKAFGHFAVAETVDWFAQRGVALKTEPDGRMFPVTDSSQTIIDCLLAEAARYGVDIRTGFDVRAVQPDAGGFSVAPAHGEALRADWVCIAAGGFPKREQFAWIESLEHVVVPPVPSLFTFNIPHNPVTQLMGVAVPQATARVPEAKLAETAPLLITHWGLSGPAVLRLSAWGARHLHEANYTFTARVQWLAGFNEDTLRTELQRIRFASPAQKITNTNPFRLPQRLWDFLLAKAEVPEPMRWADLPAKAQNRLVKLLTGDDYAVRGKTTFKEEFVTCGGVELAQVEPSTMESRRVPGLFFAGEVLDVDGITGGFNFQHAWTSGWLAARAIAGSA